MKKLKYVCTLLGLCCVMGCTNSDKTEKYQQQRNEIVNVHSSIKEIPIKDVMISSTAHLYLLDHYLIIADYKSPDKQIHIFDKNSFKYLVSTAQAGHGPDEITIMGHIGVNNNERLFYASDYGKRKIYSYAIDSLLANPDYCPRIKTTMNALKFPDRYQYINDTLSFALMIEPTSVSTFKQSVAKWNMQADTFEPMKYEHPDITKKRISFAVSEEKGLCVECYTFHDLMSILTLDGELKYNIYGPAWDKKESNKIHHYDDVVFCGDKIIAAYSGGDNFSDAYAPTKLLVFNLEGDYLKTLDVGYRISSFCYDKDRNRLIMVLDDEIQFGYLDLDHIL